MNICPLIHIADCLNIKQVPAFLALFPFWSGSNNATLPTARVRLSQRRDRDPTVHVASEKKLSTPNCIGVLKLSREIGHDEESAST
jgi:hypothetical protein